MAYRMSNFYFEKMSVMKIKWILFLFAVVTLGLSCEAPIVFSTPQPEGVRARDGFESAYLGRYFCAEDSAVVDITGCCLVKTKQYAFTVHRDSIAKEPGVVLTENDLYVSELDQHIPVTPVGDNEVKGVLDLSDTLFTLGPRHVLKSYRGHLVLNRQLEEGRWEVNLLSRNQDGSLSFFRTILPEELADLEKITPVEDISTDSRTRYELRPSRRAFRQLLKTKLIFEGCSRFERMEEQ